MQFEKKGSSVCVCSNVWRADSSSDRDVKTFARLAMREKLISLDSCVKLLNTDCVFLHFMQYLTEIRIKNFDKGPCRYFFFFFLITGPSGFSLRNPLLFLQGCFHPAPTLPDKRLKDNLTKGEVYALLIAAFLGKGIGLKNIR